MAVIRQGEVTQQSGASGSTAVFPRLVLGSLLTGAVLFPGVVQPLFDALWDYLYKSSLYRFSGFETLLTISCYIIIEPLYTYKFGSNPALRIDVRKSGGTRIDKDGEHRPRVPRMRRPSKRVGEVLIYAAPLLLLDMIMVKKFAGVPVNEIRRTGGYGPVLLESMNSIASSTDYGINAFSILIARQTTSTAHDLRTSFLVPMLHNFTMASPVQLERALPPIAPTSRRIILELATSFFIYDALFFFIHIAFHRIRFLAKIHAPHHTHAEMHPQVTNKLSITERLSLIMLANFALNIIGCHVVTRTCFVPLFVWLLIEVHSGLDLAWGYDKLLPKGWGAGTRVHAQHHRTGEGAYAPFFGWWDAGLKWFEGQIALIEE